MSRAVTRIISTGCDTRLRVIERDGAVLYSYERLRAVGRTGARVWCVVLVSLYAPGEEPA